MAQPARLCLRSSNSPSWFFYSHFLKLPTLSKRYCSRDYATPVMLKNPQKLTGNSTIFGLELGKGVHRRNLELRSLGNQGKVSEARKMFDEMPQRDVVSYASMITIYLKQNDLPRAESLYSAMPERYIVADSAMVHAYAKVGQLDLARKIFDRMPCRNVFSWTGLISGYFKHGRVDDACELFRQMPEKNVVSWTTMLLGFARNGLIDQAQETFDQMPVKNVVSWTAMIRAYVESGQVDQAFQLFYQMPERNLYSWNIMIQACLDYDLVNEAVRLFNCMPWTNAVSWTTMVTGLAQKGFIDLARKYFDQMPSKDIIAWNAMVSAYADHGIMSEASKLFSLMPNHNMVTWNAMIDGYAKNGHQDEALKHFVLMLRRSSGANAITLTSVVIACEGILELLQAHGLLVKLGLEQETSLTNALVTMYSRSGDLSSARLVFENLEAKDILSWTAMILAYSNHGYGNQALQIFAQMLRSGNKPDEVTFVGVLTACSHAGLVKKGQRLFDSMRSAYNIIPNKEHYCCLVDILGRAGLVNEAVKVVYQMPPGECDGAVLGALLGSCKLYGEVALAKLLGERLLELEPSSSGSYVLLSNLYATCGLWDNFAHIRKRMKESRVNKVPGFSQVEVKGENHVFYAADRSHKEMEQIYAALKEKLLPVMQDKYCMYEAVAV
ncbi:pentatricopeptide repeat-containing protein At4g02750-like [Coffea eugenioides]|uniref:Pentatricopeptide repeat-containing protein At4g02750-like n=1 Tax=Coffea arabica TaxID=13443 RepID=A0A6P6XH83_COFAR|nr:pentatricopeptide repeat-containing protein At4g02750-like [Coffea arabica]XP_027125388.1 pentatricopeptide repeat-containing protein At4g02750-like [Coffea arabica]XP_027125389.1 pentatricopeptide repeat-containing protein At4g02750-like [Coffea arabica]XP_027168859.1 pentatricopeptide repeat-containing protein At4g02750-like [Coffea eugenioides]XP_027168860.1 pentatricopeptide repeat-containing protein At4g02750-like [Coffea eugenioides]XP_027168861.1 pentatricopeptide repeat-containing p